LNRTYWNKLVACGALDFLSRLKREGRILHAGFSFHDDTPVFKEIVDGWDWDFCQIQYNFLDEELQVGTAGFEHAVKKGLAVVIMEPLKGGALARPMPPDIQAVWDKAGPGRTPVDWALRWLWDKAGTSVLLSGMNALEQLEENCAVCDRAQAGCLSEAERAAYAGGRELFTARNKVACAACADCMPCPSGVSIPAIFQLYNDLAVFDDWFYTANLYNNLAVAGAHAELCAECGQCVEQCPQQLTIPEKLQEAHAVLQPLREKVLG
jgi:predicted aldo/keto reductase-like oxidoreductase